MEMRGEVPDAISADAPKPRLLDRYGRQSARVTTVRAI
jgi:hypothetical protein